MEKNNKDHKKRLRERYLNKGLDSFHDYEVLELILTYTIIRKDTKQIAKKLLEEFGSLTEVLQASPAEIMQIKGLGERSVVLLKLFKDAHSYILKDNLQNLEQLSSSEEVFNYFRTYYSGMKTEEFRIVFLNTKNRIIKIETLSKGTLNEARVYIRNLLEKVIHYKAASVILVHNHPSGDTIPSSNDLKLTKTIKQALNLIEVKLLDHLIIGRDSYNSII